MMVKVVVKQLNEHKNQSRSSTTMYQRLGNSINISGDLETLSISMDLQPGVDWKFVRDLGVTCCHTLKCEKYRVI